MNDEKKLGQEPAFAALSIDKSVRQDEQNTEHYVNGNNGMSKRFYAACAAMQGILSNANVLNGQTANGPSGFVRLAYRCADELLKQENE
jgi:hypothetical protein